MACLCVGALFWVSVFLIRSDYCLVGSLNDIPKKEETHLWASDQRTAGRQRGKMGSVITEDRHFIYFRTVDGRIKPPNSRKR